LTYEKDPKSGVYNSLTALLKVYSKHFDENVEKQDFLFRDKPSHQIEVPHTKSVNEGLNKNIDLEAAADDDDGSKSASESANVLNNGVKRTDTSKSAAKNTTSSRKKSKSPEKTMAKAVEPSSKWKYVLDKMRSLVPRE
jgi:hypothetical protein